MRTRERTIDQAFGVNAHVYPTDARCFIDAAIHLRCGERLCGACANNMRMIASHHISPWIASLATAVLHHGTEIF